MKIGFVVDGDSEYGSLPALYAQLQIATGNQFLKPLKASLQPKAPTGAIARASLKRVLQLESRGAHQVVVLIDRENRDDCAPELAAAIRASLAASSPSSRVSVVVKDRTFENWLLADLDALRSQPQRFNVTRRTAREVSPDKADHVNAQDLISRSVVGGRGYHKVKDSQRILDRARIERMAANSRSFRRLLAVTGHPSYSASSRMVS